MSPQATVQTCTTYEAKVSSIQRLIDLGPSADHTGRLYVEFRPFRRKGEPKPDGYHYKGLFMADTNWTRVRRPDPNSQSNTTTISGRLRINRANGDITLRANLFHTTRTIKFGKKEKKIDTVTIYVID